MQIYPHPAAKTGRRLGHNELLPLTVLQGKCAFGEEQILDTAEDLLRRCGKRALHPASTIRIS